MQTTAIPRSAAAAATARTVSLRDSLVYTLVHVIPNALQGTFVRSRFWVSLWTRIHPDPLAVRFVSRMRRKYGSDYLYVRVLTSRTLLVLGPEGIRHVLDHSPAVYADPRVKRDGMSHFQPDAVTISRGVAWKDRRRFNEEVLAFGQGVHPFAEPFLDVVQEEVLSMLSAGGTRLTWKEIERAFERITLGIVFGREAREDTALTERLTRMMREANRPFGRKKSRDFDPFYAGVRGHLQAPAGGSLAAVCRHAPSTPETRVENQVPHWMFAMKDTLATNVARALALIMAHPQAEERVRAEVAAADLSSPAEVDGMRYLEGCVQEAMRLWPTTPILARETLREDTVEGVRVPAQTQVFILNGFNHRNTEAHAFADTFSPEVWLETDTRYEFNHLSNGPQVCAGKDLVLFLAKAFLATVLSRGDFTLEGPALDPGRALPHAYDYFRLRFARQGDV